MYVLVACEESQEVCKAFRQRGHLAFSCDLQECSGGHPEWHIIGNVIAILNPSKFVDPFTLKRGIKFKTCDAKWYFVDRWDLIIAHPPCTYLTKASACRMYPKKGFIDPDRFSKALAARSFFMKILNADCDRVCVENPTPLKCVSLPDPTQVIQPYEFGHPYSKRTLLWLKGLPLLNSTNIIKEFSPYLPSNTSKYSKVAGSSCGVSGHSACDRSKTFSGIAAAMAEQWG